MFKVVKGLSPVTFAEAFPVRQQSQYNMRNYSYFAMPRAKTVNYRLEIFSYIDSKLWDSIPSHMKELDSINEFKHVNKTWKLDLCSCRLCKVYLQNIGYLKSAKKITYMYSGKSEYHNRFFPVYSSFFFSFCLVICLDFWNLCAF